VRAARAGLARGARRARARRRAPELVGGGAAAPGRCARPAAGRRPARADALWRRRAEEHTARLSAEAQAADASRRLVVAQEQARAAPAPAGRPAQPGRTGPERCAAQESPPGRRRAASGQLWGASGADGGRGAAAR